MIQTFLSSACVLFGLISILACTDSQEMYEKENAHVENESNEEIEAEVIDPTLKHDTTIFLDFNDNPIEVIIKFPTDTAFKGTIIALPGWNYPNSGWCENTELCEKAIAEGYALLLPEMGKSIYCDSVFPETRKDWLKYPTRKWVTETMIASIQKDFKLLIKEHNNFVMGLSTGARGAVLLALDLPEIFSACGAISGDFDQTKYTKDKLYNGYYGSFKDFPDRWIGNDNAITSIKKLTVPVYLAHGQNDKIVPIEYSQQLFVLLQENGNKASILNINPNAGHTYEFWNSEVDAILAFFEKFSH